MDRAIVWSEGRVVPAAQATVSVLDAAVLFGDGLFETMRAVEGVVEWAEAHVDRLLGSAGSLALHTPARDVLLDGVRAAAAAGAFELASVRLTVSRGLVTGPGPRGAASSRAPTWWVMVTPVQPGPPRPATAVLLPPELAPRRPEHKSLSWQHAVVAQIAAGDHEGIYVNAAGEVTEGISSNVFACFGDALRTPPVDRGLPGVTRGAVIAAAAHTSLTVDESPLRAVELAQADEIMLSGAVGRLRPVIELDGRPVGDGRPGRRHADLLAALQRS